MKSWTFYKRKYNLMLRKNLLNLLLLLFSPSNKFMIVLSQNLDKHIASYQKELAHLYNKQHKHKSIDKIAA